MRVCLYRTNSVCLPDRTSLAISSSKTSFPFSANANPSLCALHSCPAQQITSWPITGGWRISVWTVPWLSIWSLGTSCKRSVSTPASRQRPRTNRGANLLLSGQHTHAHTDTNALINEKGRVSLLSVIRFSWAEAASCLDDHLVIYSLSKRPGKCSPCTLSASLSSIAAVNQYATVDHRHHVSEREWPAKSRNEHLSFTNKPGNDQSGTIFLFLEE